MSRDRDETIRILRAQKKDLALSLETALVKNGVLEAENARLVNLLEVGLALVEAKVQEQADSGDDPSDATSLWLSQVKLWVKEVMK